MPKIMHLADVHLGAAYVSLPGEAAQICHEARFHALAQAVGYAGNNSADAILLAGDLFDMPSPPRPLVSRAMDLLSRAKCPVLISPGNHDYIHPESPYLTGTLPENVHVFTAPALTPFMLDADTAVWGAAFCGMRADIVISPPAASAGCNILLLHGDLQADAGYNTISISALAESGYDYAAFGHNHAFSGLRKAGSTYFSCSGCLMGRGFHETDTYGFVFGEVSPKKTAFSFLSVPAVSFCDLAQDISAFSTQEALQSAVRASLPEESSMTCLALTLTGSRQFTPDLPALEAALSPLLLHIAIADESRVMQNPWRYLDEDNLQGALTRRFYKQYQEAVDSAEQTQALHALLISLAALEEQSFPL